MVACLVAAFAAGFALQILSGPRSLGAFGAAMFWYNVILPTAVVFIVVLTGIAEWRREPHAIQVIAGVSLVCAGTVIARYELRKAADERAESIEQMKRTWGATGSIQSMCVQPDGRILVTGAGIARLLPDGEEDTSFRPEKDRGVFRLIGIEEFGGVGLALLPDARILVAGDKYLVRLRQDGSLDKEFSMYAPDGPVEDVVVQPDGRFLVTGSFWHAGTVPRWGVFRMMPTGILDDSFHAPIKGCRYSCDVKAAAVQVDGRILIAGSFGSEDEKWFGGVARLNVDGSIDPNFAVRPSGANQRFSRSKELLFAIDNSELDRTGSFLKFGPHGEIENHKLNQPDVSAILPLASGGFLAAGGIICRLLPNGKPDSSFHAPDIRGIESIAMQGDKILVLTTDHRLYRLMPDGTRDGLFHAALLKVHA